MDASQVFAQNSKWLKRAHLPQPRIVTIREVTHEEIKGDKGVEHKLGVYFHEPDVKPLLCNTTNGNRLVALLGPRTEGWINQTIEVYDDPMIEFSGKIVGGVRVRQVSAGPAPVAAAPPVQALPPTAPAPMGAQPAQTAPTAQTAAPPVTQPGHELQQQAEQPDPNAGHYNYQTDPQAQQVDDTEIPF